MKRSALKPKHFPLKDTTLISLESEDSEYRVNDGDNLHFVVHPKGNKRWEFRYKRPNGKWSWLGLGAFPEVGGKLARSKAEEARKLLSEGIDPKLHKDEQKQALLNSDTFSFKSLAEEYCNGKTWTDGTRIRNEGALKNHVYPTFAKRDYRTIRKQEWLNLIKEIQQKPHPKTGKPIIEMGNRVRGLCKDIYDLAEVTERIELNPLAGIEKFIDKHEKQNMPHLKAEELPDLLKAIRAFKGRQTSIALQLSIMLGCRPSEMRKATWDEFDFKSATWSIPAHRMKKRIEHFIPLPNQAIELLNELKVFSGKSPYLFKSRNDSNKPISDVTFGKALKTMGYKGRQTPHGFRHNLSTALREKGFQRDWVEAALAHKTKGVEGTYNKAIYLSQRRTMMQHWADYLDNLANGTIQVQTQNDRQIDDLAEQLNLSIEQKQALTSYFEALITDSEQKEVA